MRKILVFKKWVKVSIAVAAYIFMFSSSGFCGERYIRFVTCEWEPYYGSKLFNQGYVAELTREALKRVGYEMSIDFVPWKRALHDAKNGYYDALLGLYFNEERAQWVTYSQSIAEIQLVFFAKKGRQITWNKIEDLQGYTIGVRQGFVYTDEFDNASFLKKEAVRSDDLNLKKLLENRIDLILASRNVFLYWVKNNHPDKLENLVVVPKPLSKISIYHGFTKRNANNRSYVTDFDRGMEAIIADGTFEKILKKHGFKLQ